MSRDSLIAERCKELVSDGWHSHQCSRKAVKEGYCKQHHPDTVAERRRKSEENYKKRFEQSPLGQLQKAREILKAEREASEAMAEALRDVKQGLECPTFPSNVVFAIDNALANYERIKEQG